MQISVLLVKLNSSVHLAHVSLECNAMPSESQDYIQQWRVYTDGPTNSVSFNETPVEERAEPSNTARILVVLLEDL